MRILQSLCLLLAIIALVDAHAAMLLPRPWFWAPSRTRPCGSGSYNPVPVAQWASESTVRAQWWTIAGDGLGPMHMRINPRGDINFTDAINMTVSQPQYTTLTPYNYPNVTIPNVQCTGPNNTCTVQAWSDSGGGWYSCSTVQVVCPKCQTNSDDVTMVCMAGTSKDLTFCSGFSNTQFLVTEGYTAKQMDQSAQSTWNLTLYNPNVFGNGNDSSCAQQYKEILCKQSFPPCQGSPAITREECTSMIDQCQLQPSHDNYYNCADYPSSKKGLSSGAQAAIALVFIGLFIGLIIAAAIVYHKKGSLFGLKSEKLTKSLNKVFHRSAPTNNNNLRGSGTSYVKYKGTA